MKIREDWPDYKRRADNVWDRACQSAHIAVQHCRQQPCGIQVSSSPATRRQRHLAAYSPANVPEYAVSKEVLALIKTYIHAAFTHPSI